MKNLFNQGQRVSNGEIERREMCLLGESPIIRTFFTLKEIKKNVSKLTRGW